MQMPCEVVGLHDQITWVFYGTEERQLALMETFYLQGDQIIETVVTSPTNLTIGSFRRVPPLPTGIDAQKAEASFKKGVLTITIPKTEEAKNKIKKIEIKPYREYVLESFP